MAATKAEKRYTTQACSRCGGTGIFSQFHGVCYRCGGDGIDPKLARLYTPEEQAKRDERNAKARVRREAKRAEQTAIMTEANVKALPELPAIWQAVENCEVGNPFIIDVAFKARDGKALSDKQLAALRTAWTKHLAFMAEEAAKDAARQPFPAGKAQQVTGTILTTKFVDHQYGSTFKMLVEAEEGFKVWCSVPRSLDNSNGPLKGCKVQFIADLEASQDDQFFGFGKRPRKATFIERPEEG